jgi:hypothetical protein
MMPLPISYRLAGSTSSKPDERCPRAGKVRDILSRVDGDRGASVTRATFACNLQPPSFNDRRNSITDSALRAHARIHRIKSFPPTKHEDIERGGSTRHRTSQGSVGNHSIGIVGNTVRRPLIDGEITLQRPVGIAVDMQGREPPLFPRPRAWDIDLQCISAYASL